MDELINREQGESIKITKNSKGYNWEIKLRSEKEIERQIGRLNSINEIMKERFIEVKGGENGI